MFRHAKLNPKTIIELLGPKMATNGIPMTCPELFTGLRMSAGELGCCYASMVLFADGQELTDEKIKSLLKAANIECESYWPGLFIKALGDTEKMTELITTPGGGGGGGGDAAGGGETLSLLRDSLSGYSNDNRHIGRSWARTSGGGGGCVVQGGTENGGHDGRRVEGVQLQRQSCRARHRFAEKRSAGGEPDRGLIRVTMIHLFIDGKARLPSLATLASYSLSDGLGRIRK